MIMLTFNSVGKEYKVNRIINNRSIIDKVLDAEDGVTYLIVDKLPDYNPKSDEVGNLWLSSDKEPYYKYEKLHFENNEIEKLKETNSLLTSELAKVKIDIMMMKGGVS